jgi:tetratricopeptide (TPR) repeat protein
MKRLGIAIAALLVLGLGAVGYWWWQQPRTSAEAFERTTKIETRLGEKLRLARDADPPDPAEIAALEGELREIWGDFIERWPDSPEAPDAQYRLLTLDLEAAEPGEERLRLIEAFMEKHPEHERIRDLMWSRSELLRDEMKDPLGAVQAFGEIEAQYPDDPIAPRAALAAARIYDAINEPAAAARAYAELAEKYPDSPEAEPALMRQAALLEEQLGRKREAAEIYRQIAEANPSSAAGRQAQGRRRQLLGELEQSEQDEYYRDAYHFHEFAPYDISQEEFFSPTRQRIRAQGFEVDRYVVQVKVDPMKKRLEAQTTVQGRQTKELKEPLLLELSPMLKLSEVTFTESDETAPLRFEHRGEFVELALPAAESAGERALAFNFAYAGAVPTWSDDSLTTEAASLWGETKWYPQTYIGDMYTQDVTVDYPEGYEAVGQGARVEAAGDPGAGWQRTRFVQDKLTQFMTLAVGRFVKTTFTGPGGLPMEIYVAEGHSGSMEMIREGMERSVELYLDILGPFPFEKLAIAEVPEFPGGYGSASLILLGTITFEDESEGPEKFIAHEIAHQWFGNLLSLDLQDGSIPWLSEGFATYCDAVYTERTAGRQAFLNQIRRMGNFYRQNALMFEDRPISETLWRNPMYRSLMYEKGGLVLHALRREMGDEAFFRLIREFIADNHFRIVRISDFKEKAEAVAGRPMDWFFEQALDRTGYARLSLEEARAEERGEGWRVNLTLNQEEPSYRMKLDVLVELEDGGEHRTAIDVMGLSMDAAVDAPDRPRRVRLDPDAWHLLGGNQAALEREVAFEEATAEPAALPAVGR